MYKYLIINHIPRCGGSSLRKSLYDSVRASCFNNRSYISDFTHGNLCLSEDPIFVKAIHPNTLLFMDHSRSFYIEDFFNINLSEAYRAITIRNPVDRFISHINYFHKENINELENILDQFVNEFGHLTIEYLTDYKYSNKSLSDKLILSKSILKDYDYLFKVEESYDQFNNNNPFRLYLNKNHVNSSEPINIGQKIKNKICKKINLEIKLLEDYYEINL